MTDALQRRLLPLQGATFAGGFVLWYGVEKLFMTQLGFDARSIGLFAAAYAAVVPLMDVGFGVLADRWSRKGVLMLGYAALAASSLAGALSHSVGSYLVSGLLFGMYAAAASGTTDSIVYDTLLEETGSGEGYPREAGRLKLVSSAALLAGSVTGGAVAAVTSARTTYALTIPVLVGAMVALRGFSEPVLHRGAGRLTVRDQAREIGRVLGRGRRILPVVACLALGGTAMSVVGEFHQLWLLEGRAPVWSFGLVMASMFLGEGLGGLLAGHVRRGLTGVTVAGGCLVGSGLLLATGHLAAAVLAVPLVMLALSWLAVSVGALLHDQLPSAVRAAVSSGIGSLTWVLFVPVAVGFGAMTDRWGVGTAAWLLVTLLAGASAFALSAVRAASRPPVSGRTKGPDAALQPTGR